MQLGRDDMDRICKGYIIRCCRDIIGDFWRITLISRLCNKNMVYKIESRHGTSWAVKVFLQTPAVDKRVVSELIIDEIYRMNSLTSFAIVPFDHFILIDDLYVYGLGIRPWISGCALSDAFAQNPAFFFKRYAPIIKKVCTEIWACNDYPTNIEPVYSLYHQSRTTFDEVFSFFKTTETAKIAHIYMSISPTFSEMCLINGDYSLHEFVSLSDGRVALIDWEELSIGTPTIDIANLFSSMLQNNGKRLPVNILLEYWLSQFHIRDILTFYYYLIERVTISLFLSRTDDERLLRDLLSIYDMLQ